MPVKPLVFCRGSVSEYSFLPAEVIIGSASYIVREVRSVRERERERERDGSDVTLVALTH